MLRPSFRFFSLLHACFAGLLAASVMPLQAGTDFNKWAVGQEPVGQTNGPDGLDDVWQWLFNAWALVPNEDEDGDGSPNSIEAIAGTNPFAQGDRLRVGNMALSANTVVLTFDAKAGKKYRVLSDDAPNGTFATVETLLTPAPGLQFVATADNPSQTVSITQSGNPKKFYRVETSDVDTTGDGVSDWAKRKLGMDPTLSDTNNDGLSDFDEISQELQLPDTVTIQATKPFASEDGPESGTFTVTRGRSLLPVTANYTANGTAAAGVDYDQTPLGWATFPSGVKTATIHVNVLPDAVVEGGESVTTTLTSASAGAFPPPVVGSPASATVIINNTAAPTGTGLLARYYDHATSNANDALNFGQPGTYNYTRGNPVTTTGSIVVSYTSGNFAALQVGHLVKLSFTSGNLNLAAYNHANYPVTALGASSFTVSISAATALPNSSTGNCSFSLQSIPHPAIIERIDPVVDYDWAYGTPNDVAVTPNNPVENYSTVFEGYLHPTTAGNYQFQLDADDKARVLLDINLNGTFDLPGEEIVEHGWDGATTVETIGTFKASAAIPLAVPGSAATRYKIRVEHVETTGDARCRLQWREGSSGYVNIPSTNVFSHTQTISNYSVTSQVATINTSSAHNLTGNPTVTLNFSAGGLFTPPANYSGSYTVASVVDADTFTVNISGAPNMGTGGSGFMGTLNYNTNGWLTWVYTNTSFTAPAGYVGVLGAGATNANNGLWGSGTPDPVLIAKDTFSIRWTGQVQPQFSEDYTFVVHADDGCTLRINGQVQELKTAPSTFLGGTYSYNSATGDAVFTYTSMAVKPDSFIVGEIVRVDPTSGNLTHGTGSTYTYDGVTGILTVNYSNLANITPGGFAVGETIELDPTAGSLTTLSTLPYVITSEPSNSTFTVYVEPGLFDSQSTDATINILDTRNAVVTAVSPVGTSPATFTISFGTGKYSTGTGNMNVETVNKPLKDWSSMGNERYVRIPMIGGTRYDIQLDYWESGGYSRCRLFWYSPSQPKQIIPADRLYPSNGPLAPAVHVSETDAVALVGGAFSYLVRGSNGGTVSVNGSPPWLTYSNGVLSGTPPAGAAGNYQVLITITNGAGTSTSVLNLTVDDTGGGIEREYWNGVAGTTVASIPLGTPPTGVTTLTSLEAPTDFGDNYGARIRGYVTAPVTGNYYFWIAASNSAELWISNDDEPINAFKRAWVANGSSTPRTWNAEPNQKSPWLALERGKRYYIEVLHKAGVGSGDNLAVGWAKPGDAISNPGEGIPDVYLSPYVTPPPGSTPGTLYVATMLAQSGAATNGVGNATLRLSEDENTAIINFSYSGLTGALTDWHVHVDPYLSFPTAIVYDGTEPVHPNDGPLPDGSHHWTIEAVGPLSKANIIEIIKQGKAYINLHTVAYPNGEIRGNYTLANGSRTFTPPPPPPDWTADPLAAHTNTAAASRFLTQATYGPRIADITALQGMASYDAWIEDQFTKPASLQLPEVLRTENASAQGGAFASALTFNAWWWRSIAGDDQLRQRIAFALSEIHVVSAQGPLENNALATSYFYDKLAQNAFGNFRDILEDTTLTPSMGRYLDMLRNDKPDQTVGRIPNENYAREIKQLFSVGLYRMWPDGTLMLNSKDSPIDTYTQREIIGFAHVFTGWDYGYDGAFRTFIGAAGNWTRQMREVPARHFTGPKRVLNNVVLPGLPSLGTQPLDPYATHSTNHFNEPTYQALPAQELDVAHDQLFNHPNVGPFICRQLIQRLVTSHPSRDYLYRVVQKFNDNGSGVRGDMKAVIKAILLDYEARSPALLNIPAYGKQREPVMRVAAAARAFRMDSWSGTYSQTGTRTIAVTMDAGQSHGLSTSGTVFLDFTSGTGGPAPWIGAYAASGVTATSFNVTARDWAAASSYSIPANSTTCTINMSSHWLDAGNQAYFDFTSVSGGAQPADGVYTVVTSNATNTNGGSSFTINVAAVGTARTGASGSVAVPRFTPGSFTTSASGLPAPNDRRVTMDTNVNHELEVGDQVQLNFYFGSNPQPADRVATVESIVDLNTWTFLAPTTGTNLSPNQGFDAVFQFPLKALPMTRNGTVGSRPSTFAMGSTTADLEQTPINSPTVFNFFVPDYKYPGTLASQGITTPEFAITAETSAIRQANYLYNGLFNPNQNAISSFNTGNNSLVMNFSPWLSTPNSSAQGPFAPTNSSLPWTHNQNLPALIDHLSTLLMAGQLSTQAKTVIRNFIATPISSFGIGTSATVNTTVPHNLNTGDSVVISGVAGGTFGGTVNGLDNNSTARAITKVDADTFTINSYSCTILPTSVANAHVSMVGYNNLQTPTASLPTATQMRDRLRSILHLILSSPDFTIQR